MRSTTEEQAREGITGVGEHVAVLTLSRFRDYLQEQRDHGSFLRIQVLSENLTIGSIATGSIGGLIGFGAGGILGVLSFVVVGPISLLAQNNSAEMISNACNTILFGASMIGFFITAIPGFLLGLLTSPIRLLLQSNRTFLYTGMEINRVAVSIARLGKQTDQTSNNVFYALCKQVVEKYGGHTFATSRSGIDEGTSAIFTAPH